MSAVEDFGAPEIRRRADELFAAHQNRIIVWTDHLFGGLLLLQWVVGIAAALWLSPRSWSGSQSQVHVHVWVAILVGGAIASFPVFMAWKRPGQVLTRHAIAVGQMLASGLLIHLSGGRIETHFHIFGSLAILAFYRDWKVLVSATVVVALDHFLRGTFWPQSVFGILTSSPWRWMEHAGWVLFEDLFLLVSIRQSLHEARLLAERQASLEITNRDVELLVARRTEELRESHKQLLEVSRQAGMAEVANNVLHNVGNVLNSINTSAAVVTELLRKTRGVNVGKAAALLQEHQADLGTFLTQNSRGRQLPGFLEQLGRQLEDEKTSILRELDSLNKNVDHVKDIITMQQNYGKVSGVTEVMHPQVLMEDALRMNASALIRHEVQLLKEFEEALPPITVEKHKVLQILVNLIRNATQAFDGTSPVEKLITVRVNRGGMGIRFELADNGMGILPENLSRIFTHGFTTKKDGHGFGLHSGALAAIELGGKLTGTSGGVGQGASFVLELPVEPASVQPGVIAPTGLPGGLSGPQSQPI